MHQISKSEFATKFPESDPAKRTWPHSTPLGIADDRQMRAFFLPALREVAWEDGFPVPTKVAVELLDKLDYVVSEKTLTDAVEAGAIPLPRFQNGELRWGEGELIAAATYLELRQAWKPASIRHDAKKGRWRTMSELADVVGTPEAGERLGQFDTARLLVLLTEHDCREVREGIAAVLWARLREVGAFAESSDDGDESESDDYQDGEGD